MNEKANTSVKTQDTEVDYIKEIHNDMVENSKKKYSNAYDFPSSDRVKITVEIVN